MILLMTVILLMAVLIVLAFVNVITRHLLLLLPDALMKECLVLE